MRPRRRPLAGQYTFPNQVTIAGTCLTLEGDDHQRLRRVCSWVRNRIKEITHTVVFEQRAELMGVRAALRELPHFEDLRSFGLFGELAARRIFDWARRSMHASEYHRVAGCVRIDKTDIHLSGTNRLRWKQLRNKVRKMLRGKVQEDACIQQIDEIGLRPTLESLSLISDVRALGAQGEVIARSLIQQFCSEEASKRASESRREKARQGLLRPKAKVVRPRKSCARRTRRLTRNQNVWRTPQKFVLVSPVYVDLQNRWLLSKRDRFNALDHIPDFAIPQRQLTSMCFRVFVGEFDLDCKWDGNKLVTGTVMRGIELRIKCRPRGKYFRTMKFNWKVLETESQHDTCHMWQGAQLFKAKTLPFKLRQAIDEAIIEANAPTADQSLAEVLEVADLAFPEVFPLCNGGQHFAIKIIA